MTQSIDIHVVAGPTGSGKTTLAIKLAKELNGELINIDSRQIYIYLDIGTNKGNVTEVESIVLSGQSYPIHTFEGNTRIHLLSFLNPDESFDVFRFRRLVYELIESLTQKGKTPILVGGSGLYLAVILHPEKYQTEHGSMLEREELNLLSVEELQKRAEKDDLIAFEAMNNSDRNNPRRLIRLIEKVTTTTEVNTHSQVAEEKFPKLNPTLHLLQPEIAELEPKLRARVDQMWDAGLVAEVQKVLELGFPESSVALQGIGYREVLSYLGGGLSEIECKDRIYIAHRRYAKKQLLWIRDL